jgi:excinuclease ABC subunit A
MDRLQIVGARQHNLKNISCELPRNRLVVLTGPSGSGKSSLAFDTIYAEAQRRYVESLSAYARQFLEQLPKPDVESIEGLSPAIAISQGVASKSPRSTVSTITEISDYLRLLFARLGTPHCPVGGEILRAFTVQEIVDSALARPSGEKLVLLAPIADQTATSLVSEVERLRRAGFVRAQLNGVAFELADGPPANSDAGRCELEVVIDRIVIKEGIKTRLTDSVELALRLGLGVVVLDYIDRGERVRLSEHLTCREHGVSLPKLETQLFSFNSPAGACPTCKGLGHHTQLDPERVLGDPSRSLRQGVITAWGRPGSVAGALALNDLTKALGVDPDVPWQALSADVQHAILWGSEKRGAKAKEAYRGVLPLIEQRFSNRDDEGESQPLEDGTPSLEDLGRYFASVRCSACGGARLRPEALCVRFGGANIGDVSARTLLDFEFWVKERLGDTERVEVAGPLLRAMAERVGFLNRVGLGYLTLDRPANTLSGGESQRIRLATQLGASLVGVLYVLDEPSVGLHARDNQRLLAALRQLVDRGNSVLVVEHDREAICAADYVVDMGPGAGSRGGHVIAAGTPQEILSNPLSLTGSYLRSERKLQAPSGPLGVSADHLEIRGARANNLKDISVTIPIGRLTAVTGVSGSGKSSLIVDTLLPRVRAELYGATTAPGACDAVLGIELLDKVISIDQSPIGRTPRSNPATYTGILGLLRDVYASLPEARSRGYKATRFSFNVKGGRCETCKGDGMLRVEMQFLPDVYVTCEVCRGQRYNRETLEIRYRGLNVAEVLNQTVDTCAELFASIPKIAQRLTALQALGLGYLQLGQPATTLSGGEAQRLKLAAELAKRASGRTLYVLDEPTTGLHFSDIELLLKALFGLRDGGNTVIVVEHNLELVALCDWVIDLGPEGGTGGGELLVEGTPAMVAACPRSHTGTFLKPLLGPLDG